MFVRKVKWHNFAAYGLTDVLGSGAMAVVGAWMLYFFTTFCDMTALEAASIFGIARIVDAIVSPLVGHLSDSLRGTKIGQMFGHRRIFLLAGIPLLFSFSLLWIEGHTWLYYLITFVFFEVVYASILIPYETLAAEMTDDYKERARFAWARILVGQVAAIAAGIFPKWIVEALGKDTALTFLYMGIIFSVLFAVCVGICWAFTWERQPKAGQALAAGERRPGLIDLFSNLGSTFRVRAFRTHLALYIGGYTAIDVLNAVFTYFIVFGLSKNVAMAGSMMAIMAAAQLASVALFGPLSVTLKPSTSWRIGAFLYVCGIGLLMTGYVTKLADLEMILMAGVIMSGLGRGILIYIPWHTYNYIADVDEILTGKRREGIFAGVMTFFRKAVQSVAVIATGAILDAGGFVSGAATQSPQALMTIITILSIAPLLFLAFGTFASFGFALTKDAHALLLEELARYRSGERAPLSEQTKRVLEALTGQKSERFWGQKG